MVYMFTYKFIYYILIMKGLIDKNQLTKEQWKEIVKQYRKHYENSEIDYAEMGWMAQGSLNELIWLFGEDLENS